MQKYEEFMRIAVEEAKESLRENNHGFGAVIIFNGEIISRSHDKETTLNDPTFHAELDAIRSASKKLKRKLDGCTIISTHEPCPMCAAAIIWSGISEVVFGYGIPDSIKDGRKRINIRCSELFERAGAEIKIVEGVLREECSVLYNPDVRKCIKQLRMVDPLKLKVLSRDLTQKRVAWFDESGYKMLDSGKTSLDNAYEVFLNKLCIDKSEAPVVEKSESKIVIHSKNFCPTLEACKILKIDTRSVCRELSEEAMDSLLKKIDPNLQFSRNYEKLRPYSDYCEEEIFTTTADQIDADK